MTDGNLSMNELGLNDFWNELVQPASARVLSGDVLDPALAETIRQLQSLGATPPPAASRTRVQEQVRANVRQQIAASEQSPGAVEIAHPTISANGRAEPLLGPWARLRFPAERRRWLGAQLATAALLVVTLLGMYFIYQSRTQRAVAPPATPTTVSSISLNEQTMLTVTLPPEMLPHEGKVTSGLFRITIPAGTGGVWDAPLATCCPGLRIDYVMEGSYDVQADGPVQVLRAGHAIVPTTIAAGKEITLDPGDTMFMTSETAFHYMNSESVPVQLMSWLVADESRGGLISYHLGPTGWIVIDSAVEPKRVTVPVGAATMRLRQVEIGPKSVLVTPPGVTLHTGVGLSENEDGTPVSVSLGNESDGTIVNPSARTVTLYVLTLEPAGAGDTVIPPL